jgi:hypothetical protein
MTTAKATGMPEEGPRPEDDPSEEAQAGWVGLVRPASPSGGHPRCFFKAAAIWSCVQTHISL